MSGAATLAILLALAGLPMAFAYALISRRRPGFVPQRFLLAAVAGIVAVVPAAFLQILMPRPSTGLSALLFSAFVVIAATEEFSKFAVVRLTRRFTGASRGDGAPAGVAASLGFALFETAAYASADIGIALVRAVTAAPLHAACGARVGEAAFAPSLGRPKPLASLIAAVAIHGVYDLALVLPGYSALLPIALALIALASALPLIRSEEGGDF